MFQGSEQQTEYQFVYVYSPVLFILHLLES